MIYISHGHSPSSVVTELHRARHAKRRSPSPLRQFELHPQSDDPLFEFPPVQWPIVRRSTHNEFPPLFEFILVRQPHLTFDPPSISLRSTLYFNLIHPLFKSNPTYDPPSILTRQPHLTSPHLQSTHLRPILYKSRSTSPQTHLAKIHHQTHKQPKCYSHYLGSDLYIFIYLNI